MPRLLVWSVAIAAALPAAHAQKLAPLPQAGLWEQQFRLVVDGQDVIAQMNAMREQVLAQLPPERRQQMEEALARHGAAAGSDGATARHCLTPRDVAQWSDPKQALARSLRGQRHCTAEVVSVVGSSVNFTGRCNDAHGLDGDFTGTYTQADPKHWTYTMQGRGRMPGGDPGAAPVAIEGRGTGRWIGADCGDVPSVSATAAKPRAPARPASSAGTTERR